MAGTTPAQVIDAGGAVVILDGLPGSAMPSWRPLLTEDEARWIADYLLQRETP